MTSRETVTVEELLADISSQEKDIQRSHPAFLLVDAEDRPLRHKALRAKLETLFHEAKKHSQTIEGLRHIRTQLEECLQPVILDQRRFDAPLTSLRHVEKMHVL